MICDNQHIITELSILDGQLQIAQARPLMFNICLVKALYYVYDKSLICTFGT